VIALSIHRLIGVLKYKWWVILLSFFLSGAGAYWIIGNMDPNYKAEVTLYSMDIERLREEGQSLEYYDIQLSREVLSQFSEVIHSRRVMTTVINELSQYALTEKDLLEMTSLESTTDSNIFYINAIDKDPVKAAVVANSMAKAFEGVIRGLINTENVGVLDEAVAPVEPERNYRTSLTLLGMMAGAVMAFSALYVAEYLNPRIYSEKDIEDAFEFQVMGVIPKHNIDEGDFTICE
jgi:capsular polysaccharide biosynthesis protein